MSADALQTLLDKLCSGDEAAAEQVFLTYEPFLRRVVRRQLPDRLRAKFDSVDVVQSVWADVVHGCREAGWRFPDVDHLRAFLVRLTRNRFIDRLRQHHTAVEREQPLGSTDPEELPKAPQPRPSEVVQADELWQQMLTLCPPAHHQILRLKRQGLPVAEIATRTGLHEDSIHRILRNLARELALKQSPITRPGVSS
jgi:RNA polymerase sigma-70 factor (ECF subfamily)